MKWKLQAGGSAALLPQHSALAKIEEAREYLEELEDAEERPSVTKIAASKVRDCAKTAIVKSFKFEADHVAVVGLRRDKVGGLTKQLHH